MQKLAGIVPFEGLTTPPPFLCPQFTPLLPGFPNRPTQHPSHPAPSFWSHRKKAGGRWPPQQNLLFMFRSPSQILNFLSLFHLFSLEKEKIKGLGSDAFWTRHFLPWENSDREGLYKDACDWGWGERWRDRTFFHGNAFWSLYQASLQVWCIHSASIPACWAWLGYCSGSNESTFCSKGHTWTPLTSSNSEERNPDSRCTLDCMANGHHQKVTPALTAAWEQCRPWSYPFLLGFLGMHFQEKKEQMHMYGCSEYIIFPLYTFIQYCRREKRTRVCAEQSHNALTSTCAHSRALPSHLYWHPELELPSLWRTKCEGCGSMFYLKYSLVAKRERISDTIIMLYVSKWYILGMKES